MLGLRQKIVRENWTTPEDISNFARLTEFESVKRQPRILIPIEIPYLSEFVNRWLAPLPVFNFCSLLNFEILRSFAAPADESKDNSVSVIIPVRNEAGNIEEAFKRTPMMGPADEWIFVEGNSTDNTWKELQRCRDKYTKSDSRNIKIAKQDGKGKKDAVYKGFSMANNNILMILDGDLTVPPEDLPKFHNALVSNKGEFINGCRLVYALESDAMRFLNMIANKFFAFSFSYVLSQNLRDTLCGTKVFTRTTYDKIQANRNFFGDFDPFGDFDLIFGADRLGLKIVEVPVRYQSRTYGETNISRFRHGWLLMKMLLFVSRKLKFV
jgi:glycosyltransferase involved in cell wall biosynthesis